MHLGILSQIIFERIFHTMKSLAKRAHKAMQDKAKPYGAALNLEAARQAFDSSCTRLALASDHEVAVHAELSHHQADDTMVSNHGVRDLDLPAARKLRCSLLTKSATRCPCYKPADTQVITGEFEMIPCTSPQLPRYARSLETVKQRRKDRSVRSRLAGRRWRSSPPVSHAKVDRITTFENGRFHAAVAVAIFESKARK